MAKKLVDLLDSIVVGDNAEDFVDHDGEPEMPMHETESIYEFLKGTKKEERKEEKKEEETTDESEDEEEKTKLKRHEGKEGNEDAEVQEKKAKLTVDDKPRRIVSRFSQPSIVEGAKAKKAPGPKVVPPIRHALAIDLRTAAVDGYSWATGWHSRWDSNAWDSYGSHGSGWDSSGSGWDSNGSGWDSNGGWDSSGWPKPNEHGSYGRSYGHHRGSEKFRARPGNKWGSRNGDRGGKANPNVAWHCGLSKAIREGWEAEYRRLYPKPWSAARLV